MPAGASVVLFRRYIYMEVCHGLVPVRSQVVTQASYSQQRTVCLLEKWVSTEKGKSWRTASFFQERVK